MRGATMFDRLARAQAAAAATTAMFRNQSLAADTGAAPAHAAGAHDFDFYFGRWRVRNARLRERLAGCSDWQHFDAIQECRPILGGIGNIDDFVTDELDAALYVGMTLRLFDRSRRQWNIYWANNRTGVLEPPVTGRFIDGIGRFEGVDTHNGVPVRVRFIWSGIGADCAHWEQAFSADGGHTWETNWRMHMTRLDKYRNADEGVSR